MSLVYIVVVTVPAALECAVLWACPCRTRSTTWKGSEGFNLTGILNMTRKSHENTLARLSQGEEALRKSEGEPPNQRRQKKTKKNSCPRTLRVDTKASRSID